MSKIKIAIFTETVQEFMEFCSKNSEKEYQEFFGIQHVEQIGLRHTDFVWCVGKKASMEVYKKCFELNIELRNVQNGDLGDIVITSTCLINCSDYPKEARIDNFKKIKLKNEIVLLTNSNNSTSISPEQECMKWWNGISSDTRNRLAAQYKANFHYNITAQDIEQIYNAEKPSEVDIELDFDKEVLTMSLFNNLDVKEHFVLTSLRSVYFSDTELPDGTLRPKLTVFVAIKNSETSWVVKGCLYNQLINQFDDTVDAMFFGVDTIGKVITKPSLIKRIVPCTDEVFNLYNKK